MNPVSVIAPFPTASGAIGCNEMLPWTVDKQAVGRVYAGAIAFSVGAPDNSLGRLLVEEPIDQAAAVSLLRGAREVEERDFPVGGPFGV